MQTSSPRIVILTGAGISADSGLSTFRDANGLWEGYRVEDVASPEGFAANPTMVHRFYDARRAQLFEIEPNAAHLALAQLERALPGRVTVITQNVDDLHERAGSRDVIHMHGKLRSALCTECGHRTEHTGDLGVKPPCERCGEQALRPDIVWFGEAIYEADRIYDVVTECDIFAVVGTSGTVYPAAGLAGEARHHGAHTLLINLDAHDDAKDYAEVYEGRAADRVPEWVDSILRQAGASASRS